MKIDIDLDSSKSGLLGNLGLAYKLGEGVPIDLNKSVKLLEKAYCKDKWWGGELFDVLLMLNTKESDELAIKIAKDLESTKDPNAKGYLARLYYKGKGVPKDINKAISLMKDVAGKRKWAKISLFNMLWEQRNNGYAQVYYQLALELFDETDSESYVRLSRAYHYGIGTKTDLKKAISYLRTASEKNNLTAMNELFDALWVAGTVEAYDEAYLIAKKAANLKDSYGYYHLARAYSEGYGTYMDPEKAKKYYLLACEKNIKQAEWRFFDYLLDLGDPNDNNLLEDLVKQFEINNDAESLIRISWALASGRIHPYDENALIKSKELQKKVITEMQPRRNNRFYSNLLPDFYKDELIKWYNSVKKDEGVTLDLDNPITFDEKIQWLKIYDNSEYKTKMADKYACREEIERKIGKQYLIPLIGAYNSWEEIDFDKLPDRFVMKTNHGSGFNHIVLDKSKLDLKKVECKFKRWLRIDYSGNGFELQYKNIPRKIVIETYLDTLGESSSLVDYKIHCFNGKPKYIQCIWDRNPARHYAKNIWYDLEWKVMPFSDGLYELPEKGIDKPDNFDEMITIATILSEDFKYVRVDLYDVHNNILFGELTFTPFGGVHRYNKLFTRDVDEHLGNLIKL